MVVSACSNGFESAVIGKYGGEVKKCACTILYTGNIMSFVD